MIKFPLGIAAVVLFLNCLELPPATDLDKETENDVTLQLSKAEIYNKTLQWMAAAFASSPHTIESQDSVQGVIVGNAIVYVPWQIITFEVHFSFKITITENAYRFNGSKYVLYWHDQISDSDKMSKELALKIREKINDMEKSHYRYLTHVNKPKDFHNEIREGSVIN
jgi:hypothetical protein